MKDIDKKSTEKLLISLNDEIDRKCFELKKKRNEAILRKTFFFCCIFIIIITFVNLFSGFSAANIIIPFILFQSISLIFIVPFISNSDRGNISDEKDTGIDRKN